MRWSDVDHNQHVRHSAYYDYGAHARIRFFESIHYNSIRLQQLNIGPILFEENCSFIREIKLNDIIRVNLLRGDIRPDGSHWILYHELYNQEREKVAHIKVKGAWLNLSTRRVTSPPEEMAHALQELEFGQDYVYRKRR